MDTLEYEIPLVSTRAEVCALAVLPLLVAVPTFAAVEFEGREPFMFLEMRDVAVFFGAAIAAAGFGIAWLTLAVRRRLRWFIVAPVMVWFGYNAWVTLSLLSMYWREPWNS